MFIYIIPAEGSPDGCPALGLIEGTGPSRVTEADITSCISRKHAAGKRIPTAPGHLGARIGRGGAEAPGRVREGPLPRSPDARRAVQGRRRSPSSHPQAAAPGHELGRVRGRLAPARELDGLGHGGSDPGLARGAAHDPGRAALVLAAGDPDGADAAGGVPLGLAPDRRAGRLDPPPARARAGRPRPYDPEPAGRDAGGAAATAGRRAGPVHLLVDGTGLK